MKKLSAKKMERLREEVKKLIFKCGMYPWYRTNLAVDLGDNPSSISNAVLGLRSGRAEHDLLVRIREHLKRKAAKKK